MKTSSVKLEKRLSKFESDDSNSMVSNRTLRARLLNSLTAETGSDLTFSRAGGAVGRSRSSVVKIVGGGVDEPIFGPRGLYLEDVNTNLMTVDDLDPNILVQSLNIDGEVIGPSSFLDGVSLSHLPSNPESPTVTFLGYDCGATDVLSSRIWIRFNRVSDPRAKPGIAFLTYGGSIFGVAKGDENNYGEWNEYVFKHDDAYSASPAFLMMFFDWENGVAGANNYGLGGFGYIEPGDSFDMSLYAHIEDSPVCGQCVFNNTGSPLSSAQCFAYADIADLPAYNSDHTIAFRVHARIKPGAGSDWHDIFYVDGETIGEERSIQINDDGTIRARCGAATYISSSSGFIKVGSTYEIVYTSDGTDFYLYVNGVLIGTETQVNPGGTPTDLVFVGSGYELSDLNIYSEHADTLKKVRYALNKI